MKTYEYLSLEAVRKADKRAIEELGIPGAVLMNTAGNHIYEALPDGSVAVVCGKGNNGGDGFVVARLALAAGRQTRVYLLGECKDIHGDASLYMGVYQRLGGEIVVLREEAEARQCARELTEYDVLVDAILGTGTQGPVRGLAAPLIEDWPETPYTISVDIPSGMNGDTGEAEGAVIRAHATVTLAWAKKGFENPAAAPSLGKLIVAPIGIPAICADDDAWAALKKTWPQA